MKRYQIETLYSLLETLTSLALFHGALIFFENFDSGQRFLEIVRVKARQALAAREVLCSGLLLYGVAWCC